LGVDYIEGGWPGANPTDSAFFEAVPQTRAMLTAFGMTKRAGRSAENDDVLAAVMNAGTRAVCIVGKTHDFHVTEALGITLDENVDNIAKSVAHLVGQGREALLDAEHFFDGYTANPDYALACLRAAYEAGARWVVLSDTNGGTAPAGIGRIVAEVIAAGRARVARSRAASPATPITANSALASKPANPGRMISITPAKPTMIAVQRRQPTGSPRNSAAPMVTASGVA